MRHRCVNASRRFIPGGGGAITAESESNNTSGTADGPVGTGVGVTGSVSTSTDQDWFFFDVSAAGNINVSLAIGSSADLDWFLYNSSLTEVARGHSVANPEVGNYNAAPGRYYLMVNGYQGASSSYTLTVNGGLANSIIPAQEGFEVTEAKGPSRGSSPITRIRSGHSPPSRSRWRRPATCRSRSSTCRAD